MRRCSLCNWSDERALSQVSLSDDTPVTVCGSHYVVHQRVGRAFTTLGAMRQELGERRRYQERRSPSRYRDELAMQLTAAFTLDQRTGLDRRR